MLLVLLIFLTIALTRMYSKDRNKPENNLPIPTQSVSDRFGVSKTLSPQERNKLLKDYSNKNSEGLSQDELKVAEKLKNDSPYKSETFDLKYATDLNQFFVSIKNPKGYDELKKFLDERGLVSVYSRGSRIFSVSDNPVIDNEIAIVKSDIIDTAQNTKPEQLTAPGYNKVTSTMNLEEAKQQKDLRIFIKIFKSLLSSDLTGDFDPNIAFNIPTPVPNSDLTEISGGSIDNSGLSGGSWTTQYGNVSANMTKASQLRNYIQNRWPTAIYAGNCNCRHQRGTGSDPSRWSIHSWCGAIDFFGPSNSTSDPVAKSLYAWANSSAGKAMGIVFALSEDRPGDIHVQFIPNQPSDLTPPSPPCP